MKNITFNWLLKHRACSDSRKAFIKKYTKKGSVPVEVLLDDLIRACYQLDGGVQLDWVEYVVNDFADESKWKREHCTCEFSGCFCNVGNILEGKMWENGKLVRRDRRIPAIRKYLLSFSK